MKEAQLADGTVLEFPDSTTDSVIDAAVKKHIGGARSETKTSAGRVIGSTAARGVAGLVGLPGDMMNLLGAGVGKLAGKVLGPEYGAPVRTMLPVGSDSIVRGMESVAGPLYQPKTMGGGVLDATAQGAIMGAPAGLPGIAIGAVSGGASELAGRMTGNNPIARIGAGLATGTPLGLLMSAKRSAGPVVADALQGVDDATLRQAQSLMDDAARMGTPLTGAEALAQIKGGATPLTGIQRVVEQSRGGGPIMSQFMAQRPAQNQQAASGILGRVAPEVADPTSIAPRIQGAATQTVNQARQAGNAAAAPLYAAAGAQRIPANTWNSLTQDPAIADALQKVKNIPTLGLQNEVEGSVKWLDAAKKYLDEAASPSPVSATALERTGAAGAGRAATSLRESVDSVVPEYGKARGIVEQNMRNVVEPLKRQPIGQLAESGTFPQQRQILFPANPETLTPKLVTETVRQLTARDPQAAKDMTRQFLQSQFDEITQNLSAGPNQFGGAKFAASIAGNNKQAKNLQAAIQALPDGDEVWKGFRRFLDVMEAQGKRQPMGSATEFNRQITQELSRGGAVGELATAGASPSKALSLVSDWWQNVKYGQNTKELAEILTDPMSIERMKVLAMLGPDSPRVRAVALSIAAPVVEKRP